MDKARLLTAAIATALASSAHALDPRTTVPDFVVYAGGGSAEANAAVWAATQFMTFIDSITDQANGTDSPNYRILLGRTTKGIGTIPAGKNVLYFYKFNGSTAGNGVIAQNGSGINLLYNTPVQIAAAVPVVGSFPHPSFKLSGVPTDSKLPDWGITEEEPSVFNTVDNLNGSPQMTTINSEQVLLYDNVYGVAVTNNVFAVKQSFSKQEIMSILAGTIQNWNQLFDDSGNALPAGGIAFLDLVSGSGTKLAADLYFLNNPGINAIHPNSVTNAAGAGGAVGTGINSGYTSTVLLTGTQYQDVREASSGAIVSDLALAQSRGQRAIAVLDVGYAPSFGGGNLYSFVRFGCAGMDAGTTGDNINGPPGGSSATKYTNVVIGGYDFVYQSVFVTRPGFITGLSNSAKFALEVRNALQTEAAASVHSGLLFPSAVPGIVLDPVTIGSQDPGVILDSRNGNSTSPMGVVFDAANLGGPIRFGSEPL
jgi:hypothetical protein